MSTANQQLENENECATTTEDINAQVYPDKIKRQSNTDRLAFTVIQNIGNLMTGDVVLIDPSVAPNVGDIVLCRVDEHTKRLEIFMGQNNIVGKFVYKWHGEE